ncbi:hypothetical protein [Glutamicibacter arilaitensis]|uniref:hypothetical protein n=1 Tax=Glutamicibacter arilaitensis TaxID=256701 RepID=UPI003FD4711C
MGFWLGFQSPSPFEKIEHHNYPDEAWTVSIRKRGGMTVYSSTDARALFGEDSKRGVIDANDYTDHPGEISVFARLHLALIELGDPLVSDQALTSKQVQELLGDNK